MRIVLTISLFLCNLCRRAPKWQSETSQQRFQLDQVWVFCTQTPGRRNSKSKVVTAQELLELYSKRYCCHLLQYVRVFL